MPVKTDKSSPAPTQTLADLFAFLQLKVPKFQGMPNNSLALCYLFYYSISLFLFCFSCCLSFRFPTAKLRKLSDMAKFFLTYPEVTKVESRRSLLILPR